MKETTINKKIRIKKIIRKRNLAKEIKCKHCHKLIEKPEIAGMFLVCPHCKKLVNGQYISK